MNIKEKAGVYIQETKAKFFEFVSSRPARAFLFKLKHTVIPGFDRIPIYDVMSFFIKGLSKGVLNQRASAVSYNFFMALFPFIFFLFTVLAYLPYQEFVPMAYQFIHDFLPEQSYHFVISTLDGLLKKNGTLLTTSIIFVLYFSSQGIISMMLAFNTSYHQVETRGFLPLRITAVSLMLGIVILAIAMMFILIVLGRVMKRLSAVGFHALWLLSLSKWISVFVLIFIIISMIYYFAPATRKGYHFFSYGSLLTTILITAASWGFNEYIAHFSRYNAIFGSIGAVIILLLFIQLLSTFIIVGFELNISIHAARRDGKSLLEVQKHIG